MTPIKLGFVYVSTPAGLQHVIPFGPVCIYRPEKLTTLRIEYQVQQKDHSNGEA